MIYAYICVCFAFLKQGLIMELLGLKLNLPPKRPPFGDIGMYLLLMHWLKISALKKSIKICFYYIFTGGSMCLPWRMCRGKGQHPNVCSLLPPCGSQGSHSDHQA